MGSKSNLENEIPEISVGKCVIHKDLNSDMQLEKLLSVYHTRSFCDTNCKHNKKDINDQTLQKIQNLYYLKNHNLFYSKLYCTDNSDSSSSSSDNNVVSHDNDNGNGTGNGNGNGNGPANSSSSFSTTNLGKFDYASFLDNIHEYGKQLIN